MPYARIAITLPADILASLDHRAATLDRSRSRVVADAIRAYLRAPAAAREPVPAYGTDAVGAARRAQLERDLAHTPAQRLAAAGELARLARSSAPRRRSRRPARRQIISFDSYEDFYEWRQRNRG
ncbi:MAG TPA: ribbon-helix-helix protein, CopG family [Gemmatimonadales bacterium]|nr:ribbon-helix-helix protein, CopG family [Gemmatimonadales bacterium]